MGTLLDHLTAIRLRCSFILLLPQQIPLPTVPLLAMLLPTVPLQTTIITQPLTMQPALTMQPQTMPRRRETMERRKRKEAEALADKDPQQSLQDNKEDNYKEEVVASRVTFQWVVDLLL